MASLRRSKRSIARIGVLIFVLAAMLSPIAGHSVSAQTSGPAATNSGVKGSSYTSPSFGYSVSWDATWTVAGEENDADYNMLNLDNGTSTVYFEGSTSTDDTTACLSTAVSQLKQVDGVTNVQQLTSDGSPVGETGADRSWAVYSLTYTSEEGGAVDLDEYLDCRPIQAGVSELLITDIVTASDFNDQITPLTTLLGNLSIGGGTGGQTGGNSTGNSSGNSAPPVQTPNTGGNGEEPGNATGGNAVESVADLTTLVNQTLADINEYWVKEFPIIAPGKTYTPPKALKTFDGPINTACGSISASDAGNVGPFYCPADQTVYYDLKFGQLQVADFGNRSVVAVALAHEVGHHVQDLAGWKECTETPCLDPTEMTSQEIELQADCFAGAWTADAESRGRLGSLDVEANIVQFVALLGNETEAHMSADVGAHGSGALRTYWFLGGYYKGAPECLTVSAATDPSLNGTAAQTPTPEAGDTGDLNTGGNGESTGNSSQSGNSSQTGNSTNTGNSGLSGNSSSGNSTESGNGSSNVTTVPLNQNFDVGYGGGTASVKITGTDVSNSVATGVTAKGQYLIVYFTIQTPAGAASAFDYSTFVLADSAGNGYTFDQAATDALLKTGLPDGINTQLDASSTYNLAVVYDVPTSASGFWVVTSDGATAVQLDK